jgi:hypothetical protein
MINHSRIVFYLAALLVSGCVSPPAVQMAQRIYDAPDGIDCAFDGRTCHVRDWNSCFQFQAKSSIAVKGAPVRCPAQNSEIQDAGEIPAEIGRGHAPNNGPL